jgi:hypothetical protein
MRRTIALFVAASMALSACTPTFTGQPRDLPPYFYDALLSSELARTLARECSGDLGYNDDTWNTLLPQIEQQLLADGFTAGELQAILSEVPVERIRADTESYIAENALDTDRPQTFCAAGRSEIAAGSTVGSFLEAG